MTLSAVTIQGYRSVRSLYLPVDPCSVFVGANGVGKTNLYKALGLLRCAADGSITRAIAEEGGVELVLWAGGRRRGQPVRLILKAHFDGMEYGVEVGLPHSYEIEIGLRQPTEAAFSIEPLIKEERLTIRHGRRDVVMMERKGPLVTLRNADGAREVQKNAVLASETALTAYRDGAHYPELEAVRRELLDLEALSRLSHRRRFPVSPALSRHYNSDPLSRRPRSGGRSGNAVRDPSGHRRPCERDRRCIRGRPASRRRGGSWCRFNLQFPDLPRPFGAHELSDGTLKYLCLLGALMGYRLPR